MHYRAQMTEEQEIKGIYEYKKNDWVEIQVISAFGHAWAEAGHDVQYKSYAYGPPTEREERILGVLSGLVSSGDLLLEEFWGLVNARTYARWDAQDQFASFLRQTDVLEKLRDEDVENDGEVLGAQEEDYRGDFNLETTDIVFRLLVCIDEHYPLAVRNALIDHLGYNHHPVKSLDDMKGRKENLTLEIPTFKPHFEFPTGYLAPFCLIIVLLLKYEQKNRSLEEQKRYVTGSTTPTRGEKCGIMMNAFLLLQTFAGDHVAARNFMLKIELEDKVRNGLDFVLKSSHRSKFFVRDMKKDMSWTDKYLQPAWQWFEGQMNEPESLCGLLFRLVKTGIVKGTDERKRLKELKIEFLRTSSW